MINFDPVENEDPRVNQAGPESEEIKEPEIPAEDLGSEEQEEDLGEEDEDEIEIDEEI